MIQEQFGDKQFKRWRRGYEVRPPPASPFSPVYPGNDDRYALAGVEGPFWLIFVVFVDRGAFFALATRRRNIHVGGRRRCSPRNIHVAPRGGAATHPRNIHVATAAVPRPTLGIST